jgi:hypothetical protein
LPFARRIVVQRGVRIGRSSALVAARQTLRVRGLAATGAGFLLAVLWFDLMFDVQSWGRPEPVVPQEIRGSIAAYYRRVTTEARPMNRLVAVAMVVTVAALVAEVVQGDVQSWVAWTSLVLVVAAVSLAATRTVRNAVQLGSKDDDPERQSTLARSILRDHVACFVAISFTVALQVVVARGT